MNPASSVHPQSVQGGRFGHAKASKRWLRVAGWAAASTVLLAVFAAYLAPEMALTLAMQVWSCF